jgi:uncharacterized membrane-anchored protein
MTRRQYLQDYTQWDVKPRPGAYYHQYLLAARLELEANRYYVDTETGTEYESGKWIIRFSDASDYKFAPYDNPEAIWQVFNRAICARAARLYNRANA